MSCSASGATTRSAAIAATNPSLDPFPTQARRRVLHEIRLATGELLHLPVMNRHCLRARCNVVPQILYELELLRRAEIKDRSRRSAHTERIPHGEDRPRKGRYTAAGISPSSPSPTSAPNKCLSPPLGSSRPSASPAQA